jgi:hypothetical protein
VVRRDAQIETRVTGGGVISEDSERSQQMTEVALETARFGFVDADHEIHA